MVKYVVKCVVKLKNCRIRTTNWCCSTYGPCDYDSGDKKTKRQKDKKIKRQKGKKTKRQKKSKRQKGKNAKMTKRPKKD